MVFNEIFSLFVSGCLKVCADRLRPEENHHVDMFNIHRYLWFGAWDTTADNATPLTMESWHHGAALISGEAVCAGLLSHLWWEAALISQEAQHSGSWLQKEEL